MSDYTEGRCDECIFWVRDKQKEEPLKHGECRRLSPVVLTSDDRCDTSGFWPVTNEGDFCGEWKEAP